MYPDKYVRKVTDIPTSEHYAIIKNDRVTIPGDERSRTNPGHGYPEDTQEFVNYEAYLTKEKLMSAIEELETPKYGRKETYIVVKVTPIKITTSIDIQETPSNEITSAIILGVFKDGGTRHIQYIKNGKKEFCYKACRINSETAGKYYKSYVNGEFSDKLTSKDAVEIENLLYKE